MKRNEFKLLLEDWKKNFIVESPEDLYGLDQDDLDFAGDYDGMDSDSVETMDDMSMSGDFSDLDSDDMSFARDGHSDYLDSGIDMGDSIYSSDSEEGINGFSGMYDDDPTYSAGDHSSIGGDDLDSEDIDDLLPEIDEMIDDDYGF